MNSMTTNQNLRRPRRFTAIALAGIVITGGFSSAASATTTSSSQADVPSSIEPDVAADAGVTRQRLQGSEVQTGATGFRLQYAFEGGVRPSNPTQSSSGNPEQSYIWDEGGNRYLQWDYPMPADGDATVTMTAQLVDVGKLTDYTVQYTSKVNRTGGSIAIRTDCQVLQAGDPVDLDNESPFTCEGSSAQAASGAPLIVASVGELNWSTITGTINVANVGAGPRVSLGDGTFSTANQQRRIIMNGTAWYPVDATVKEQRSLPYATIANGANLTWMAAQQNPGFEQSEPDSHAQATFSYRIYLDGAPTSFWISGFAENYKYLQGSYPTATCAIYAGDPDGGGREVGAQATPFSCEPTGMTKLNVKTDDDTTFEVRMAKVDTLTRQSDAFQRGVKEACGEGGSGCVQATGLPQLHVTDAASPKVLAVNPNTQGNPEAKEWKFEKGWTREVTDSVEQTFGIETFLQVEVAGVKGGVSLTSETAYGYDLSKGLEYKFADYSSIPYGAIGSYVQFEAWNTYAGDLYFFGEGDEWYRVTGTTVTVPIEPSTYGESTILKGHIDAESGSDIGQVQFRCIWDAKQRSKVLLTNSTVEKLTACTIPTEWGDTVPDVPGLDEVPRDLITTSRAILADQVASENVELHKQQAELEAQG